MGIRYTDEVKLKAIALRKKGVDYLEIMSLLNIASRGAIRGWERKYKIGGEKELLRDERGLKSIGRPKINNKNQERK